MTPGTVYLEERIIPEKQNKIRGKYGKEAHPNSPKKSKTSSRIINKQILSSFGQGNDLEEFDKSFQNFFSAYRYKGEISPRTQMYVFL